MGDSYDRKMEEEARSRYREQAPKLQQWWDVIRATIIVGGLFVLLSTVTYKLATR